MTIEATSAGPLRPAPTEYRRPRFLLNPVRLASYLVLTLGAIFYVGPLLMLVNTALHDNSTFAQNPMSLATELNFDNFVQAWNLANFSQYLINSAFYATASTAIFVFSAVFVAVAISRRFVRGHGPLFMLFVIALFLPAALIPQFQLILNLGLYNTPAGYIMLFLVDPISVIILVNYIKTVPKELDEAAALDGASYFRFVVQIIMPVIKPAIATVTIIHAIGVWNDYIMASIYLTDPKHYPVTRGLIAFQDVYGNAGWGPMAAAVVMMALPMIILFLVLQRYIIGGFTAGSVRG